MKELSILWLILMCGVLAGCRKTKVAAAPATERTPDRQEVVSAPAPESSKTSVESVLEQDWGVEIEGLRLSAADYMLDFRYRVTDPQKAHKLLKRGLKPYLVDQATGAKLVMPEATKIGPLRQATLAPKKDKVYYVMFANPGRFIKRGVKVDVFIGDFVAKDIVVQ